MIISNLINIIIYIKKISTWSYTFQNKLKSEEHLLKEEKSKDNELKLMRLKSHGSALQWQRNALQHNRHVNWKFEKACNKNGKDLEGIRL